MVEEGIELKKDEDKDNFIELYSKLKKDKLNKIKMLRYKIKEER